MARINERLTQDRTLNLLLNPVTTSSLQYIKGYRLMLKYLWSDLLFLINVPDTKFAIEILIDSLRFYTKFCFFVSTCQFCLKFSLANIIYFLKRTRFFYILSIYHVMFKILQWSAMLWDTPYSQNGNITTPDSTFLASSQLITIIHWPCYCTVHVYVVIHFVSVWSFESKRICADLYCLFISVLLLEILLWLCFYKLV